jgi:hypothetical protein
MPAQRRYLALTRSSRLQYKFAFLSQLCMFFFVLGNKSFSPSIQYLFGTPRLSVDELDLV